MKFKTLLFAILSFFSFSAFAQEIRINTYTANVFDDQVQLYQGFDTYSGKIKGGLQWGAGVEVMANKYYGVELSYLRQDTKAPITKNNLNRDYTEFDLGINYIMLGGNRYFRTGNAHLQPYFGGQLGMAIVGIQNPSLTLGTSTQSKFAWGMKGGLNIQTSAGVGIKIQAQLLSAIQSLNGGFYVGTGGFSTGISANAATMQFGLGAGLVFAIPTGKK